MQTAPSIALMALCAAALIGCQSTPSGTGPNSQTTSGLCNADVVRDLIGKQANPEILDKARIESGAAIARILRPGDIVTMEYNAQRLTLSTDNALVIKRVNCG